MSIEKTKEWFEQAIPEATFEQACIQVGCHFEEVAEMFESLGMIMQAENMHVIAVAFKSCSTASMQSLETADMTALLDSIADQQVTSTGICHMLGMDVIGALNEVNRSNFSKFEDGKPVFNEYGKISKGKDYTPPNLEKFV